MPMVRVPAVAKSGIWPRFCLGRAWLTGIGALVVILTATAGSALSTAVAASASTTQAAVPGTAGSTSGANFDSPVVSMAMAAGAATKSAYQYPSRRPTITSFSPTSGPTTGGTTVTVHGTGFSGVSEIRFGTTTAATFTVTSASSITARTKAHAAATVKISVTTANGTATSTGEFAFVAAAPSIASFSPTSGPTTGGTTVTIDGAGFTNGSAVKFGTTTAAAVSVTSASSITARTRAHAAATVKISVTTANGTATSTGEFAFVAAAPTIASFSPTSGPTTGGTTVTINGAGLTGASAVKFGTTTAAAVTVTSSTVLTAKTKAHVAATVTISVTTGGGTGTSAADYRFVAPVPTIASFSPTSGPTTGGTAVTISGSELTGASAVKFGTTTAASFSVTSPTVVTATAKAHAAATVKLSVTTPGGTATSTETFAFVSSGPTITSFTPTSGPTTGGTTVTVDGTGFTGASAVKFGTTTAATFTVTSATTVTAKTKAHAAATVKLVVTTSGGTATSTDSFDFVTSEATITSFTPTSGPTTGGTTVTVDGTGFTGATAVTFGTTAATTFTVTSATTVTAKTKAHAAATVQISVTTANGTATSAADYRFVTTMGPASSTYTYAATSPRFNTAGTGSLSFTTKTVGDLVAVWAQASRVNTLTSITDTGGLITWRPTADLQVPPGSVNSATRNIVQWHGIVVGVGTTTIGTHWSRAQTDTFVVAAEIVSPSGGTNWSVQSAGYFNSSQVGTATDTAYFPALTSGSGGGAYIGSWYSGPTGTGGSTAGFTYQLTQDKDLLAFNGSLAADTMYAPTGTMTAPGNYISSGVIYAATSTPFPRQVINSAVASTGGTSVTVTFPSTTAGTDLVAMVSVNSPAAGSVSAPAGWTRVANSTSATVGVAVFVDKANPGGLTSATFTKSVAASLTVFYLEVKGVGTVDVTGTGHLSSAATTLTVTTSSATSAANELAVLAFAASPGGIDTMTSPWPLVLYQMQTSTFAGGLTAVNLTGATGGVSATGRSSAAAKSAGVLVVFKAAA